MPSQRPFFLSTFLATFRQQPPAPLPQQANKPHSAATQSSASSSSAATAARAISTTAAAAAAAASGTTAQRTVASQLPLHSPPTARSAIPIPSSTGAGGSGAANGRRRGSDSSSEGFRDVLGAGNWYVGGRTAGGEEKFFKLGVVRRVRSGDRLSLDRLSL